MTTGDRVLAVGVLLIVGAGVWLARRQTPVPATAPPDTVYVKLTAKSDTVIQRTTRTITQLDTLVQTQPGDTVFVPKEVIREVIVRCTECAEQLRAHKVFCDSARKADRDSMARLNRRIAQLEKHRTYAAIGGVITGAFAVCR